jgi:hypothetical protein
MISIVNGYVCTSSCEAASASAGKDPNAPPGVSDKTRSSAFAAQRASILDHRPKDLQQSGAVTAANDIVPQGWIGWPSAWLAC